MKVKPLSVITLRNISEYKDFISSEQSPVKKQSIFDNSKKERSVPFYLDGYCVVCNKLSKFLVDDLYSINTNNGKTINWRERLECSCCGLNNRMRASYHFIRYNLDLKRSSVIYITEHITNTFSVLAKHFPILLGSEYISDGTLNGQYNKNMIRHEDVTRLTFQDKSLDAVISFDVLEHVPDYQSALREFSRCLKMDGKFILSVPFMTHQDVTVTRARLMESGSIDHILPPQYHGDPLNENGVLCYYDFGWDLLDMIRNSGFEDVVINIFWDESFCYLGQLQFLITGKKVF